MTLTFEHGEAEYGTNTCLSMATAVLSVGREDAVGASPAHSWREPALVRGNIWEALSPDPMLNPYEKDYRWLTQVYECPATKSAQAADDAWTPSRLEYAVSVSACLSAQAQDALTLSARALPDACRAGMAELVPMCLRFR